MTEIERFLAQSDPPGTARFPAVDGLTVGRQGCDVSLDDRQVSRRHARLTASGASLAVEDLGSSNGTFVNGSRIDAPVELVPGDEVRFGMTTFLLEEVETRGDVPAPPPPSRVHTPPVLDAAAPPAFEGPRAGRRVSAARRMEATLVSYAVILATAAGVIAYLASR